MGEHNRESNINAGATGRESSGPTIDGGPNKDSQLTQTQQAEKAAKDLQEDKLLDKVIESVITKPEGAGRPSVLTPLVVRKLIGAFQVGMNDSIACHHARISRETFYRHLKDNQAFADIIQDAKDSVAILSGQTVVRIIKDGDDRVAGPLAFKMLERLMRDKYGPNTVVVNNNNVGVAYTPPSWFSNPDKEVLEGEEVNAPQITQP